MKILSLHLVNHDANVCYFDGEKATYINLERIKGIKKYHYYKWDFPQVLDDLRDLNIPQHLDAITFTIGEMVNIGLEERVDWAFDSQQFIREVNEEQFSYLFDCLPYRADKYIRVEHHYSHYMGARWLYGHDQGVVIDGCGDYAIHTSVFKGDERVEAYGQHNMVSIGDLYYDTSADFLGRLPKDAVTNSYSDRSGNLMGLMSYGYFNESYANHLRQYSFQEFPGEAMNHWKYMSVADYPFDKIIVAFGLEGKSEDSRYKSEIGKTYPNVLIHQHPSGHPFIHQSHLDWMTTWQTVLGEKLVEFLSKHFAKDDEFVYTGGVAHNVVINEVLNKAFPNMKIPPSVGDEGHSLGGMFAAFQYLNIDTDVECPLYNWQRDSIEMMNNSTIDVIANLLMHEKVVAVVQGESHIGPRALGNRSLLYLTDRKYAAHYFDEIKLKKREWWRPYGIIILEEELENYLQTSVKSPYMLHVATPTELGREKLSGVIHADDTVRYQTVNDGPYAVLLRKLRDMGAPAAVINTSLNAHGKPMVHTISDALGFAERYAPDVLVIGNEIYRSTTGPVQWYR